MEDSITIFPIARMRSDFGEKFGIPRQSGIVPELVGTVVLESDFASEDYVKGLEEFTHLWLIWGFSENGSSTKATVRPPRLGGNERLGVWATRAPFRPNPIGLSCVKLLAVRREGTGIVLDVAGADLMNGTPIYDIKPYVPLTDRREEAGGGFTDREAWDRLQVDFAEELLMMIPEDKRSGLIAVLAEDPRPAYQDDPSRIYGMNFAGYNIGFQVREGLLTVISVNRLA